MTNSGQSCNAPTRMFVPRAKLGEATAVAKATAESVVVADPAGDKRFAMGPLANGRQFEKVQSLIEIGMKEATLVAGGMGRPEGFNKGYFVRPTVFVSDTNDTTIAREEIFGPVLALVPAADIDEAIEFINSNPNGNGTAIFTQSGAAARKFQEEIDVGQVGINVPIPVPVPLFSFTGSRASKLGDLGPYGKQVVMFYTQTKTVTARWFDDSTTSH
eukprot:gene51255-62671_t